MEYRNFRDTGIWLSLLGLGCMRFPRLEGSVDVDYPKAEAIIDYAYSHGINYFDTAYVYNSGDSERATGKALSRYPRESYYLATKLPGWKCKNAEDVRAIFQEQLDRCGVDYFDFYLCHNVNEESAADFENDYVFPVLEELKAQGKIRWLGFSSHSKPELLEHFAKLRDWDFAQIQLNYLDWTYQDAKRQYEILEGLGLPVIVMEPVRGGRLASLFPEADKLLTDAAPDKSIASWAIRWAASHKGVQVVLSGMSDLAQITDNVATMTDFVPVTTAEKDILAQAADMLMAKALVPCTGCRYCCECPMELEIPDLLSIYNDYRLSGDLMPLNRIRENHPEGKRPADCIGCGQCASHCPQNIDIPGIMAELAKTLESMPPKP